MLSMRKNVELKKVRTIRFLFKDLETAGKASDEIIDDYMDIMGITLISSIIYDMDSGDESVLELKVLTTHAMYRHLIYKLSLIKEKLENEKVGV